MGLLGTIVTAPLAGPFKGVLWIVKTLAEHAEQELYDEDNIRKDLLRLEQQYELGKITIEEFESAESELLQRLEPGAKDEGRTLDHVTTPPTASGSARVAPVLESESIAPETMAAIGPDRVSSRAADRASQG